MRSAHQRASRVLVKFYSYVYMRPHNGQNSRHTEATTEVEARGKME